jgi:tetratricopeptide (TPR) repeat protein
MLAGEAPFKGPGMHELMAQRIAGTPPSIRGRRSDVPQRVDEALLRALSPDPERRFDDVATFARALDVSAVTSGASPLATAGDLPPAAAAAAGDGQRSVPHPGGTLRWIRERAARSRRVAGIAIVLILLVALSIAWTLRKRPPIDQREWILLANFENATSDSIFDRALDAALFSGLQQSDYISVVSRARVQQTLARMGRTPAEAARMRLDETLAREVARREGIRAVVAGSIHDVDGSYLITARVVDATTGDALVSEQVTVAGRAEVIAGVGEVVQRLRRAIGESATAIARRDMPLPYATTPSLDALRKYADGIRAHDAGQLATAMELWREALTLDSNFALVHAELGTAYYWSNNRPRGDMHFERALSLLDRLSPRERLQVQASVESARDNRERAITLRRAMLAEYPNDPTAWGHIGYEYMRLDRPTEAIEAFRNQIARDSTNVNQYINLAVAYKTAGRLNDALKSYERAFALQPSYRTINNINHEYGQALVLAGRAAEARALHDSMLRGSADQRAHGERSLGLIDMYEGRYDAAIARFRQATLLSQRPYRELTQARNHLFLASVEREKGREWRDSARAELLAAHALFRKAYFEPAFLLYLGKALVRDDQLPLAVEVLDTLLKRAQPSNTHDRVSVQVLSGEIAAARGFPDSAIRLLRQAQTIDSGPYVTESLARALAQGGDLAGSARLYERVASSTEEYYGWEGQAFGLLAPRDLGRVYERMGDTARAIGAYERLTSRWPAADPDILAVREARQRLSELRLGSDRPRSVPR